MSFSRIVHTYISDFRPSLLEEIIHFKQAGSFREAISRAVASEYPQGKRHPHQRRIPRQVLRDAEVVLQRQGDRLAALRDFDALHRLVASTAGGVKGIGELAVYDIAHRIGAYQGLAPDRVYLHAGTRAGARALGLDGKVADLAAFPTEFAALTAAEIEDCLCIFKGVLLQSEGDHDGEVLTERPCLARPRGGRKGRCARPTAVVSCSGVRNG
jgi:hypothetical protein